METIHQLESYHRNYKKSIDDPEAFWSGIAETFHWQKKWDKVLEWDFLKPDVKWFLGGRMNITENCLDRHLEKSGEKTAFIWEPNNPDESVRTFTYRQLHEAVCRFSNVLKNNGAQKGDRICIYMPMVPEAVIAMLACARIGAIHSVVFAGFSAQSLSDRIQDSDCSLVITSDGAWRGNKQIPVKDTVDEALEVCPGVRRVIVLERTGANVSCGARSSPRPMPIVRLSRWTARICFSSSIQADRPENPRGWCTAAAGIWSIPPIPS
jgi:acetyl-CoA synthetase